jgi:signal transduction histidine kinase
MTIYSLVKQSIEANIESELKNTNEMILNMVKNLAHVSIKNHLRAIADKNVEIMAYLYRNYQEGTVSRAEIFWQIRNILTSQIIGKTGYIYCINSQGTVTFHPNKQLEHTNVIQYDFVKEQVRRKEGYLEYQWKNPGETAERPKALYMSYFKPLDWIVSVSSYRNEFDELIELTDFSDDILSLRFGETGYAYVVDIKGGIIDNHIKGQQHHPF